MFANQLSVDEFKSLATDTRSFLKDGAEKATSTRAQLNEIMMAQDFQDLTGQVIKRVVDMVQVMESQLLQVLIEVMPEDKKAAAPEGLMNGPVVNSVGRDDVVTTQEQVDDLLESLGF
jgi:chemotaxis protein CheZ